MHDVVNQILNETSKRAAAIKIPDQNERDMKKDKKRDILAAITEKTNRRSYTSYLGSEACITLT